MKIILLVTHEFKEFKKGDRIAQAEIIQTVLASANANKVVRVAVDESSKFAVTIH